MLAIKSAIVKPIPASKPPPASNFQLRSEGRIAIPERTASQLNVRTPIGLPRANPTNTATVTEAPKSTRDNGKPALANAKSGMMVKATHGCSTISRRSTGDNASRVAISAICNVCRSLVSPLPWSPAGCATTWFNIRYKRSSFTHLRAGVINPSITPVIVAWIPDASTANQMKAPARK